MNAYNDDWLNWQSVIGSRKVWRSHPMPPTAISRHQYPCDLARTEFTLNPQPVASMFCCRCRGVADCECAGSRWLSMSVGATLDAIKAGLVKCEAIPAGLFPIQLAENQLLLTTPTTPMSVQ